MPAHHNCDPSRRWVDQYERQALRCEAAMPVRSHFQVLQEQGQNWQVQLEVLQGWADQHGRQELHRLQGSALKQRRGIYFSQPQQAHHPWTTAGIPFLIPNYHYCSRDPGVSHGRMRRVSASTAADTTELRRHRTPPNAQKVAFGRALLAQTSSTRRASLLPKTPLSDRKLN